MKKFMSRAKFKNGKILCCSQIKCIACKEKDKCEEIDIFIESPYEGIQDCMKEKAYKRVNGRVRQK